MSKGYSAEADGFQACEHEGGHRCQIGYRPCRGRGIRVSDRLNSVIMQLSFVTPCKRGAVLELFGTWEQLGLYDIADIDRPELVQIQGHVRFGLSEADSSLAQSPYPRSCL